jgi:tetratricopeptide (TPR) repeat protein
MAVDQYLEAFRVMQTQPEDQVAPELREALLTQLCTQLTAAHQYEMLIRLLQSPLARRGGLTASLHFGWGLAYLQLQQFENALQQFRQCIALRDRPSLTPVNRDIRKAAPHHCLAICLFRLGRLDEATEAFHQALAIDAQSRPVRFDFAAFLGSCNRGVDALKILHGLTAEKADDLPVWLLGADIALKQPQFLEFACQWTSEGIKFFPEDKMLTLQRAEALTLTSQMNEALPYWQQASAPANATHRAAQILCELAAGEAISTKVAPQDDAAVSKEFIQWYQRLLGVGMTPALTRMNERIALLKDVLPTAGRTIESALAAAQTARV